MSMRGFSLGLSGLLSLTFAAGCAGTTETIPADAGTDGSTVVLDGGGPIPQPPDGPSECPQGGVCNYQTNAGCGAQETCAPVSNGSGAIVPGCVPAGTSGSGAVCAALSDCAPGYVCANGACRKLCCGGDWSGCPSDDEHCYQALAVSNGNGGAVQTGAMLCLPVNQCDALVPTSCAAPGTACLIVDGSGATACVAPGAGDAGEPCPCKGGFLCVNDGGTKECRRLCKAVEGGGEPACEPGEGICIHYHRDPPGVGECTPED